MSPPVLRPRSRSSDAFAATGFSALGTTVRIVVADPSSLPRALGVVEEQVETLDRSCSRFRPDSELSRLNRAGGRTVPVGALLFRAIEVAITAARLTEGLVDPTVGRAMLAVGYDRDFASIVPGERPGSVPVEPAPGTDGVVLDPVDRTVRLPADVQLDLGASAKALGADLAARAAADETGCGVLVGLGGDIAVGGPPPSDGWPVRVAEDHRTDPGDPEVPGQTVRISVGGLATSSVTIRRWRRAGTTMHHILDPRSGRPATVVWRTVSVAASSCVHANVASTAAIILGDRAPDWLGDRGVAARLVRAGGEILRLGGWPEEVPS